MCGIVGIIGWNKNQFFKPQQQAFKNLVYLDAFRGEDGTGAFGVNKWGNVDMIKTKDPAGIFVYSPEYQAFEAKMYNQFNIVVGHNRKATVGKIQDDTAHPFISGDVIMVHNGRFQNHDSHYKTEVDSEALCKYLEANEENLPKALSEIDGAFSVVWYNAKTQKLRFWRNKERPMWHVIVGGFLYFASERSILHAALVRAGVQPEDKTFYELAEDIINEIDMTETSLKWKTTALPPKPVKEYPKSSSGSYYGSYYGAHWAANHGYLENDDEEETTSKSAKIVQLPKKKTKTTAVKATIDSLNEKIGKWGVFRLVDFVQSSDKPSESYVEGYQCDNVSTSVIGAPASFFQDIETWPHQVKYFRGKVSKVKTMNGGKTYELELEPDITLVKVFLDADNKMVSYSTIETIGGEEAVFCERKDCYTTILPDDWEDTSFSFHYDDKGEIYAHNIVCKDCLAVDALYAKSNKEALH